MIDCENMHTPYSLYMKYFAVTREQSETALTAHMGLLSVLTGLWEGTTVL